MKDCIKVENLTKKFGSKTALNNISLTINEGMFGLLGRNGAGKTTFMRILTTVSDFDCGSIHICDIDIKNSKQVRNIIGYLPQNFMMYPNLTVYEVMDYLGALSEIPVVERRILIPELLSRVNLENESKVKVKKLSGGMKQRLGIAQALLNNPKVLVIDEPTVGLDPEERIRFRNLLCELASERIIILSTHIVGDIEATCNQIAIIDEGNILYQGSVNALVNGMNGKVYSIEIPSEEVVLFKKDFFVTETVKSGTLTSVRFISDNPVSNGAISVVPNVEDAYIYTMWTVHGVKL